MTIWMLPTIHGCASTGVSADVWCRTNEPIRPTAEEYAAKDRASKERMAVHNAYGIERCGWRP